MATTTWFPPTWHSPPARHQLEWPDGPRAAAARETLAKLPPLVLAGEARAFPVAGESEAARAAEILEAQGYGVVVSSVLDER